MKWKCRSKSAFIGNCFCISLSFYRLTVKMSGNLPCILRTSVHHNGILMPCHHKLDTRRLYHRILKWDEQRRWSDEIVLNNWLIVEMLNSGECECKKNNWHYYKTSSYELETQFLFKLTNLKIIILGTDPVGAKWTDWIGNRTSRINLILLLLLLLHAIKHLKIFIGENHFCFFDCLMWTCKKICTKKRMDLYIIKNNKNENKRFKVLFYIKNYKFDRFYESQVWYWWRHK